MTELTTEKITVNLARLDLAQIDVLVERGFFPSRAEFIRDAVRRHLERHAEAVHGALAAPVEPARGIETRSVLGILSLNGRELQAVAERGTRLQLRVIGAFRLAPDVTPDLARQTLDSVWLRGILHAAPEVKAALQDRLL